MSLRKIRINMLRLAGILIVFLAIFVRPTWAITSTTAFVVEFIGYLFLLAGLAIRIWAIFYIGGRKSDQLVTDGPYSICRNPLYVGTFFVAVGAGLCFENLPMLITILVLIVPLHIAVAALEQKHLRAKFPDAYTLYEQKTPLFLPRFSSYYTAENITVSVPAIRRILVDTSAVILIPIVEDLLEILHENAIIPVLWQFP